MTSSQNNILNDLPLVSVIVPLYNGGDYIESTLNSVLSQTYKFHEIIVMDDGSTDDGPSKVMMLMKNHPDRIQLLHHPDQKNHWIAASRNVAIQNAKGTYIAFLDQDDIWLPDKLEKQVYALQRFPKAAFAYAKSGFIDQNGIEKNVNRFHPFFGKGIAYKPANIFKTLIKENFIPTLTVVIRKSCIDRIGLMDEGPRYEYEDWLYFSKLAFFYEGIFIPEVLANYRIHNNNYSATIFNSGKYCRAEEHYTITLYSFLMDQKDADKNEVHVYLRRRIWFFFLRARSWGTSGNEMNIHMQNLIKVFPIERRTVRIAFYTTLFFIPIIARTIRRLRRNIIGN
jgi:glycosyltransferase involved in cell wall biosynthesis